MNRNTQPSTDTLTVRLTLDMAYRLNRACAEELFDRLKQRRERMETALDD